MLYTTVLLHTVHTRYILVKKLVVRKILRNIPESVCYAAQTNDKNHPLSPHPPHLHPPHAPPPTSGMAFCSSVSALRGVIVAPSTPDCPSVGSTIAANSRSHSSLADLARERRSGEVDRHRTDWGNGFFFIAPVFFSTQKDILSSVY